jgi:hypothetical protein
MVTARCLHVAAIGSRTWEAKLADCEIIYLFHVAFLKRVAV